MDFDPPFRWSNRDFINHLIITRLLCSINKYRPIDLLSFGPFLIQIRLSDQPGPRFRFRARLSTLLCFSPRSDLFLFLLTEPKKSRVGCEEIPSYSPTLVGCNFDTGMLKYGRKRETIIFRLFLNKMNLGIRNKTIDSGLGDHHDCRYS